MQGIEKTSPYSHITVLPEHFKLTLSNFFLDQNSKQILNKWCSAEGPVGTEVPELCSHRCPPTSAAHHKSKLKILHAQSMSHLCSRQIKRRIQSHSAASSRSTHPPLAMPSHPALPFPGRCGLEINRNEKQLLSSSLFF